MPFMWCGALRYYKSTLTPIQISPNCIGAPRKMKQICEDSFAIAFGLSAGLRVIICGLDLIKPKEGT